MQILQLVWCLQPVLMIMPIERCHTSVFIGNHISSDWALVAKVVRDHAVGEGPADVDRDLILVHPHLTADSAKARASSQRAAGRRKGGGLALRHRLPSSIPTRKYGRDAQHL